MAIYNKTITGIFWEIQALFNLEPGSPEEKEMKLAGTCLEAVVI